jgi:Na+-transporting NADH:ubiquinone oxidoreductase subunit NqrF
MLCGAMRMNASILQMIGKKGLEVMMRMLVDEIGELVVCVF